MRAVVLDGEWAPRAPLSAAEERSQRAPGSVAWRHPRYRLAQVPEPRCGPREVLVRVRACGVCGSDTHCYETDAQGYVVFSGPMRLPVVPGHEYAGEVVEVGSEVRGLRVGELVCAEGMLHCGVCEACRVGQPNQCPHLEMVGFSAPGAWAELISVEERFCWSLDRLAQRLGSARRALELGALVEPLSCPYQGIWVSGRGMRPGDHAAVFGCGPIGLGAIALARAAGAATIIAFDVSPARCASALALGADEAHDPRKLAEEGSSPAEEVRRLTRGWGADLLVEAAGAALHTMPQIERAMAPGAQMIYLGRTGERVPVALDTLVSGASSIVGSRGHGGAGAFRRVVRLMEEGRLDPSAMITGRMPLDRALEALERSTEREDAKILLEG